MIKIFLIILISILLMGCSINVKPIPKDLFNEIKIMQKPEYAETLEDVNKRYFELYKAYKNNLLLLEYIEKINNER